MINFFNSSVPDPLVFPAHLQTDRRPSVAVWRLDDQVGRLNLGGAVEAMAAAGFVEQLVLAAG